MKRNGFLVLSGIAALLVFVWLTTAAGAGRRAEPAAPQAGAPTVVSYQGQIVVDGVPYSGTGYFKFAVVNAAGDETYWSNDDSASGGAEPHAAVAIDVTSGLFSVLLGDEALPNMVGLPARAFDETDRYLRVWFSHDNVSFELIRPDRRIAAVPYALQAEEAHNASTLEGQAGVFYQNAGNLTAGTLNNARFSAYSDLASEEHLGDAAGDLAQNNGTLQANLNADLLDDRHAGNASGNLPLSNGTVNTNLNADLLDGQHASAFQQKYGNVVVVAKSGGDYTTISAALTAITDASATNRYLVWVAPGVYTERVTMKPHADIQGAGELVTKISYVGSPVPETGTVIGANNAELRFLTVANTGGDVYATAIYNRDASPRLTHTVAAASGGSSRNFGVASFNSSPTMTDVTAVASGATINYGVYNNASSTAMLRVIASASGGTWNYGVYNEYSSSTLTDVIASASGVTNNTYGLYNFVSSPLIRNSAIDARGGTNAYGVYNHHSSPTFQSSTMGAWDGASNYGIYNDGTSDSHTVKVNNCQVTGSTNTIRNSSFFVVRIGASQLDGGAVTGGGTVTCIGVYDEIYASPGYNTCP